eukprot:g16923.t1
MAINAVRSERRTDEYLKLKQSTDEVVAPGTYEPGNGNAGKHGSGNHVRVARRDCMARSWMRHPKAGCLSYWWRARACGRTKISH